CFLKKLAQRGAGAMDMEEILGLGSGDFEGVDFAASSESDVEEEPAERGAVKVVPRSNTTTSGNGAEISNVENTPAAAAAAAATPLPAVIGTTTIVQRRRDNPSDNASSGDDSASAAEAVDAEPGSPLPEHACGQNETFSLLRRVERCCLESSAAEIETAIAALSSGLREAGLGETSGGGSGGSSSS
ncbi:unnamed protein product, partial [Laminaria digitata]